jgi:putative ABC transport system permease protein
MTRYYIQLALRGLLQHRALTALMVFAIGLGIAATMTGLTILSRYGSDPIPQKSAQLFAVQLDNWTGDSPTNEFDVDAPPDQLTYMDAMVLMQRAPAKRQTAMYLTSTAVQSDNAEIAPSGRQLRATKRVFFEMFELQFIYGGAWTNQDDQVKARVTVLTQTLAELLFGKANPVGKQVQYGAERFSVIGVVKDFAPKPKFYDLNQGTLGDMDDAFIPFATAVDLSMTQSGNTSCFDSPGSGWANFIASECVWVQYWVELENAADAAGYQRFLDAYADEQHKLGRFSDTTRNNHIVPVKQWLKQNKVVPEDSKIFVYVSIGFLLVCLINALGLMLAKFLRRSGELGVRRALGASKRSVFIQHLFEAAAIGASGGALGALLTVLGLKGMHLLYAKLENFAVLDLKTLGILIVISISATVLAGLLPAWRVSQLAPAHALKAN